MKTLKQLDKDIDSIKKVPDSLIKKTRTDLKNYFKFIKYKDSVDIKKTVAVAAKKPEIKRAKSFNDVIPDSLKVTINDEAAGIAASVRSR